MKFAFRTVLYKGLREYENNDRSIVAGVSRKIAVFAEHKAYREYVLLSVEMKIANTKNEGTVKSLWQQF